MKRALTIAFWVVAGCAIVAGCGLNPKVDLPSGDNASGAPGVASGTGGSAGGIFGAGGAGAGVGGSGFPEASGGFATGAGGTTGIGGTTASFPPGGDAGAPLRDAGVNDRGPDAGHDARPDPLHD